MLRSLHIENIAVIKSVDIDFDDGFCVLTGETGAGKSILIDSINLLIEGRMSKDIIRMGENAAMVSALFDSIPEDTAKMLGELGVTFDSGEIMLERRISLDGRSSARINGRSVTLSLLRDVGRFLVSIHGQNDNQKLMQKVSHLNALDSYADTLNILEEYHEIYSVWKEALDKLASLQSDESERLRLREMLEFQINDIESAKLKIGEEEKLTAQRDRLLNQEKISRCARIACRALIDGEKTNAKYLIDRAETALEQLAELDIFEECDPLIERLSALKYEAEDISERIRTLVGNEFEGVEDVTAMLDKLEGRLDTISRLGRKYGSSIEDILEFRNRAKERLEEIDTADERIIKYEADIKKYEKLLERSAKQLTEKRMNMARGLSDEIGRALTYLDMPKVRFEVSVRPLGKYSPNGADDVEFLISTNPGEPLMPMVKIASGGELSRIMLALRSVLDDQYGMSTSIYDEVDTGISGRTSRKVGIKLNDIAKRNENQVICVTHSAQIASLADAHYVIEKRENEGRSYTSVRRLDADERVEEIARILGGLNVTDAQRQAARELIAAK